MAITFKREFIISQLGRALRSKEEAVDERVENEIETRIHYRDQAVQMRADYINGLSKVNFAGKPDDVRRAVGAVNQQYGNAISRLTDTLATDKQIRDTAVATYRSRRADTTKPQYVRAVEILKASNTENLSFADLKSLGIVGIESYGATAITSSPEGADKDGITPHTEEG